MTLLVTHAGARCRTAVIFLRQMREETFVYRGAPRRSFSCLGYLPEPEPTGTLVIDSLVRIKFSSKQEVEIVDHGRGESASQMSEMKGDCYTGNRFLFKRKKCRRQFSTSSSFSSYFTHSRHPFPLVIFLQGIISPSFKPCILSPHFLIVFSLLCLSSS